MKQLVELGILHVDPFLIADRRKDDLLCQIRLRSRNQLLFREAVFGDDKVNETYNYYDVGCSAPRICTKDSDGVLCDGYGVAWPLYEPHYASKSGGKVVINWTKFRKHVKDVCKKATWVEVQYGTKKNLKNAAKLMIKIKGLKKNTVIQHLKRKKDYYFRVRLSNGKKALSNWTGTVKIRTK